MDERSATRTSHNPLTRHLREVAQNLGGDDLCELGVVEPAFVWLFGSTMVEARIDPVGRVELKAFLVHGPASRDEVATDLALFSAGLRLGELKLDEDGDVVMMHRVQAQATSQRIAEQVELFCQEADRLDDIVSARLGGERALDRLQSTILRALRLSVDGALPS
jgi:hypothetical protein